MSSPTSLTLRGASRAISYGWINIPGSMGLANGVNLDDRDARLEKLRWWVESKVRKVVEVWTIGELDRESDQIGC